MYSVYFPSSKKSPRWWRSWCWRLRRFLLRLDVHVNHAAVGDEAVDSGDGDDGEKIEVHDGEDDAHDGEDDAHDGEDSHNDKDDVDASYN